MRTAIILLLAATLFAAFCFLGSWQLQRRAWKLDLIAQVESQLQKAPVPAPDRSEWADLDSNDAYTPATVEGVYLHGSETLVQAMTAYGSGYWVITPLRTADGRLVLINRGFVDSAHREPVTRPTGQLEGRVQVTGLLRLTEPDGRFLRPNEPEANRWFSRDVNAIGEARGLSTKDLAPFFIDADAQSNPRDWPVGGLTVVRFRNTHLIYAITWYALAALSLVGAWIMLRNPGRATE